jgi:hypothetical protein
MTAGQFSVSSLPGLGTTVRIVWEIGQDDPVDG